MFIANISGISKKKTLPNTVSNCKSCNNLGLLKISLLSNARQKTELDKNVVLIVHPRSVLSQNSKNLHCNSE